MEQKLLEILEANVNMKGLVEGLLTQVAIPALKNAASKTGTPLDDLAINLIAPQFSKELVKQAGELWSKIDGK